MDVHLPVQSMSGGSRPAACSAKRIVGVWIQRILGLRKVRITRIRTPTLAAATATSDPLASVRPRGILPRGESYGL